MDIHRSRFVPYNPSAINALAFSHVKGEHGANDPKALRLAIGRANGNIEIWNPSRGTWLQEKIFYGGKERSVEGLLWIQEPDQKNQHDKEIPGRLRLLSIGYSSSVTEWDLATGLLLRNSTGSHSAIWCFAAQPRKKGQHQKLVAGCSDGSIVLLSTQDSELDFERVVHRTVHKKARALSVTYKNFDIVLAGFADSTMRILDTNTGNVIRIISLGTGPQGGPRETLVWKVKYLPDGNFICGDSNGEIRIYDGKTLGLIQRISGHEADVLDLAVSQDGTTIFSAGMDRRTCIYSCKKGSAPGKSSKWHKISHQRYHEHDVKALATYEGSALSILVSGGIDTVPIVLPIRDQGKKLSRQLAALPPIPPLVSAPKARFMASWWGTEVRIWRVRRRDDGTEKPKVAARIALQGDENITSVTISPDGTLLGVATANVVKLFHLTNTSSENGGNPRIKKLEVPFAGGARLVKLSSDAKWLATITMDNKLQTARIILSDDSAESPRVLSKAQILRRLGRDHVPQSALGTGAQAYERFITLVDFSEDGNFLAVADLAGFVDTWVLEGHADPTALEVDVINATSDAGEDGDSDSDSDSDSDLDDKTKRVVFLGQLWIPNPSGHVLPRLDATPVLLSFQPSHSKSTKPQPNGNPAVHPTRSNSHPHSHDVPSTSPTLLLVSSNHRLSLFDLGSGRLTDWSRRNPPSSYPPEYQILDEPAKGCIWSISEAEQRLWLYGEKWLFMFNLTRDFSRKRKRDGKKPNGADFAISEKEVTVTKSRKFVDGEASERSEASWIDVTTTGGEEQLGGDADVDMEDDSKDDDQVFVDLRRSNRQDGKQINDAMSNGIVDGQIAQVTDQHADSKGWWHTFKYRPILGIVPMGDDDSQAPEVVLVERPSWDFDLPPRFMGAHEE